MNYMEFCEKVPESVRRRVNPEADVEVRKVPKNNGVVLDGLTIMEPGFNIAPTIYLEPYYEHYLRGMSFEFIVSDILRTNHAYAVKGPVDVNAMTKFETVKDRIRFRLVNIRQNRRMLEDMPHIPYLDLAVIFYFSVNVKDGHFASVTIHNELLAEWSIGIDDLLAIAYNNMLDQEPAVLEPMETVLDELHGKMEKQMQQRKDAGLAELCEEAPDWHPDMAMPLYVLSNKSRTYGAACMLYRHVFKDVAERENADMMILPSSVHELILLPDRGDVDAADLREMVLDVNTTQLLPFEILSDNVYRYSRATERVTIA